MVPADLLARPGRAHSVPGTVDRFLCGGDRAAGDPEHPGISGETRVTEQAVAAANAARRRQRTRARFLARPGLARLGERNMGQLQLRAARCLEPGTVRKRCIYHGFTDGDMFAASLAELDHQGVEFFFPKRNVCLDVTVFVMVKEYRNINSVT